MPTLARMAPVAEWWKNETFIPLDWSPPPVTPSPPRRRWPRRLVAAAMIALVATSGALGWLAWKEHGVAQKDQALVALQATQLRTLQSQVATNRQLATSTSTVTAELHACIQARGRASTDLFGFLTGADNKAESICNTAEADYQQLLSSAGTVH